MTQEVQKATNRKAIEMMRWDIHECVISDLNRDELGRANIWYKESGKDRHAVAARFSYEYHYDINLGPHEVITTICGEPDCVNFLHLTCEPVALVNFRKKNREKRVKRDNGTVSYNKTKKKYVARITVGKHNRHLGYFTHKEAALRAVEEAAEQVKNEPDEVKKKYPKGVSYNKTRDKYIARVTVDRKQKSLGSYATEEEAIAAIAAYRKENNLV